MKTDSVDLVKLHMYKRKKVATKKKKKADDEDIPVFQYEGKPSYLGVPLDWNGGPTFLTDISCIVSPFDKPEWFRKQPVTAHAIGLRTLMVKCADSEQFKRYFLASVIFP